MKVVLEFGVRGGAHTENIVLPSAKVAEKIASSLVHAFTNDPCHPGGRGWYLGKHTPRITWTSSTHFVAISKLDGVPRGPASAGLWRKSDAPPMFSTPVEHRFGINPTGEQK